MTEETYYRWRKEYGGLKSDRIRRTKDLEVENQRLRKAIADLTPDKLMQQQAFRRNSFSIWGSSVNSSACTSLPGA